MQSKNLLTARGLLASVIPLLLMGCAHSASPGVLNRFQQTGPLAYKGGATTTCLPAAPGEAVTWADVGVGNQDPNLRFTVTSAVLVSPTPGLETAGVGVLDSPGGLASGAPFRTKSRHLLPLPQSAGGPGLVLAFGVRAESVGDYTASSVRIQYRVSDQDYSVVYPNGIRLHVSRAHMPCT